MPTQWNYKEIALDGNKSLPLYLQLAAELRRLIGKPRNAANGRMPSILHLSQLLNVDRTTVRNAYRELLSEGVIRRASPRVLEVVPSARGQLHPFPNIGIILPCPFSMMVDANGGLALLYLKGIIDAATQRSISTIMVQLPRPDAEFQEVEPFLDELERRLQGVIHLGDRGYAKDLTLSRLMRRRSIPQVVVSAYPVLEHIACVTYDALMGANALAEQLLHLGHHRVGIMHFLSANQSGRGELLTYASHVMAAKFEAAFLAHGLECHRRSQCFGCSSYPATLRALERKFATGNLPTAYWCISDEVAAWTIRALRELGLKVPEDISVIGFNDVETTATSGLTTLQLPFYSIGAKALELLLSISEENSSPRCVELPTSLVIRQTLGHSSQSPFCFGNTLSQPGEQS